MNPDPGSLSNLRDIVTPSPAPWWPLAAGWYVVIAIALIGIVVSSIRVWKRWKANAYRREALNILREAATPAEVATILKRTALAAFPRSEVASLTGDGWCDWLEKKEAVPPLSDSARDSLSQSVFAQGEINLEEMRGYALTWVREHRVEVTSGKEAPC